MVWTELEMADPEQRLLNACWKNDFQLASKCIKNVREPRSVKDWFGRTPLHLACRNGSVDFAKLLIKSRNCDPDCKTKDGTTPLHEACTHGQLSVVKLLVNNVCDRECRDMFGWTPLHRAVDADHPHLNIVRYLVTSCQCDPECRDEKQLTALHHACGCYSTTTKNETKALEMVKFLIETCNCDPSQQHDGGMSPLLFACRAGLTDVVRYLLTECHCDVRSCDKDGNMPLHLACQSGNLKLVRFLILEQNCDPDCENHNKEPPLEFAAEPEVIRELIRYGAKPSKVYDTFGHVFGKPSHRRPFEPPIKVFVMGNPSVGKSTLIKAVQNETASILGRWQKVTGVDAKTAGIIPYEFESKKYGHVTLYDFAGQREFYANHAAVLQSAIQSIAPIFIVVVDLQESEKEIKENIIYWLSFLKNQCTSVTNKPHLIVIGSYADMLKPEDTKQKLALWASLQTEPVFSCIEFAGFIAMDCQYPESPGMNELRQTLKQSCDALRATTAMNFNCHCFLVYLLDRFRDSAAVSLEQIHAQIKRESVENRESLVSFVPESLTSLCSLCDELNDRGHVLFLKNTATFENSWVIIDRPLLLSEVIGTIFAPEGFKQHCNLASCTGVVPLSKIAEKFQRRDPDMLVGFLSHLEFCHKISDPKLLQLISNEETPQSAPVATTPPEKYCFFPALVTLDAPRGVWEAPDRFSYRCGWILQCSPNQFLTSRFLQVLILRLAFYFALAAEDHEIEREVPALQRKCKIWKNGIYWGNEDGVETLVEVVEQSKAVIALMQSAELSPGLELRSSVIRKILETVEEFCPKVSTFESFISPLNTKQHPFPPVSTLTLFSINQIAKAIVERKSHVVTKRGKPLPLVEFLCFEPYAGLQESVLQQLFNEDSPNYTQEVSDKFFSDLADCIPEKKDTIVKLLKPHPSRFAELVSQRGGATQEIIRAFQIWRDREGKDGTYLRLRQILDQFSAFAGRNPLKLC